MKCFAAGLCTFVLVAALSMGATVKHRKPTRAEPEVSETPAPAPRKKRTPPPEDEATPTPSARSAPAATPKPKATVPPEEKEKAAMATPVPAPKFGPNVTLSSEDLAEFEQQPAAVQSLLRNALELTAQNLTYSYGSSDPATGGMDCSGTIYYLLQKAGFADAPRDSAGQYAWARRAGNFRAVVSRSEKSFEFGELRPGDLLFWTGTYSVEREIPVTHVMLYLGTERKTKRRVMFGASDGRSYGGVPRWGVSVFDFQMPRADPTRPDKARAVFIGYAAIPGLRNTASVVETAEEPKKREHTTDNREEEKETSAKSTPKVSKKRKSS
jgi:cell wall-associated NlpC family hydrolase